MKYHKPSSYLLALGDHLRWTFSGSPDAEAWLAWMARVLGLREGEDDGSIHVHFIRRHSPSRLPGSWLLRLNRFPGEQLSTKLSVPTDGWTMRNFGSIRIWSHLAVSNIICELSPKKNDGRELVMMWYALHIIYSGIARSGGLPLHAALVSIGGMGSLIAGGDGAGKSTCCRRIAETWTVLADDGVLIVPRNGTSCVAHPLPTWSDLIMDRNQRTCVIEQGVPLSAVFFLEKDSEDRAIPLGQGHASLMINASASGVFRQGLKKPDPVQHRNLKKLVFDNSCRIGKTVPAFLLRVSPSGEFWKRMEETLAQPESLRVIAQENINTKSNVLTKSVNRSHLNFPRSKSKSVFKRSLSVKTLQHLLKPIKIRALEIPNRLVVPPMGTGLADIGGVVSEANLSYIKRRAQSGAGLIIMEITAVHPAGQVSPRALGVWDDKFIPGLSRMAATVHSQGVKVALQLHHCGRESYLMQKKNLALAPSAIPSYIFGFLGSPREMTLEEIEETIAAFGAAALRAKAAGFDAVELHGAHGYLLMQFLSGMSNQRQDKYGGDFKNRSRFMMECVREVRQQVGPDFPVSVRISGEEGIKGGYSVNDMQTIVPDLVAAGADIIHVSFGTHGNMDVNLNSPNPSAPVEFAPGFNSHLAKKIKEVAPVSVISVGRYTDPFLMDEVIARGDADMIAVGRQHLADPDFLKNAIAGSSEDTMECLACNQGCIERLTLEQQPIRCAINPETGQELIRPEGPAKIKRNVWVIGAGPAGLTAAFEAARLGHQVTLYEREKRTGGNARYAALAPHKDVYERYIITLTAKCKSQGVEIRTGVEVTEAMIDEGRPEAVVLAIGADKTPCPAETIGTSVVCDAWQVLDGEVQPKDHVVIIGGGLIGMETADFLREKGVKNITVVEMLPNSPVMPQAAHGQMLHRRLRAAGVTLSFGTTVKRIEEGAVLITKNGENLKLEPVSQVIIAIGVTPRNALKDALTKKGLTHFVVGDAVAPRRIIEATTEGANAAWSIE